ncbi:MAG: S8 family serine peptidase [Nitrospinae bacterium]|nr:S8 family serine peptidase [Nitrospinota bacterium]
MRWLTRLMVCMVVSIIFMAGAAFAAKGGGSRKIVVFREGTSFEDQEQTVTKSQSKENHHLSLIRGKAVALPPGGEEQALRDLRDNPAVEGVYDDHAISADHVVSITPVPAPVVELFPWGVERMGIPVVSDLLASGEWSAPMVAILDTGIDQTHPELREHIAGGYNARAGESLLDYQDYNGHGTHMAGIIAAAWDGQGIKGAAAHPRLVAVKVLDNTGHGYLSDLIAGLQWVYAHEKIKLVNMSLSFSEGSPLLQDVIKHLHSAGVILVASAGNRCGNGASDDGGDDDGGDTGCDPLLVDPLNGGVKYPARYPEVIAVAATDIYNKVPDYSRSGPEVAIAAPGGSRLNERILSTTTSAGYGLGSGTSPAAAHVTGGIAAVLQLAPWLSDKPKVLVDLLQQTATDLGYPPERQGAGLIAVDKMVKKLLGPVNDLTR